MMKDEEEPPVNNYHLDLLRKKRDSGEALIPLLPQVLAFFLCTPMAGWLVMNSTVLAPTDGAYLVGDFLDGSIEQTV
jgi:hypothetical protein|eukprot:evm.model.NODE_1514_length_7963_cov_49.755493.2